MGKSNKNQQKNDSGSTPQQKANQREMEKARVTLEKKSNVNTMIVEALVFTLLSVFPLYLNADRYYGLTEHKANFFWIVMALFTVALIVVWLAFLGLVNKSNKTAFYKKLCIADWAAVTYFCCILVSCFTSPFGVYDFGSTPFRFFMLGYPQRQEGVLTLGFYLIIYFIVSRLFVPRERDWVAFAISANVLALIGVLQFLGYDFLNLFPYEAQGMVYPYASLDLVFRTTLGNVDIVSAYVSLTIAFFTILYCKSTSKLRFLYLATVVTNFLLMMVGGADAGKLGLVAGVTAAIALLATDRVALSRLAAALGLSSLSCLLYRAALHAKEIFNLTGTMSRLSWEGTGSSVYLWAGLALLAAAAILHFLPITFKMKKRNLISIIIIAVIVVTGFLGVEIVGSRIEDPENIIHQAREVLHLNLDDSFGSYRGFIWNRLPPVIAEHPLFGTGPDTFFFAFEEYQDEAFILTQTRYDKAHNELLQIAVCSGLIAMFAFLVLYLAVTIKALPKLQDSPWLMAATVAAFSFFVQSMFGVSVPIATPLFFVILGVVSVLTRQLSTKDSQLSAEG